MGSSCTVTDVEGQDMRCLVENIYVQNALGRKMAEMRPEKRPRSLSPNTNREPSRGRARLSSRPFSPLCSCAGVDLDSLAAER